MPTSSYSPKTELASLSTEPSSCHDPRTCRTQCSWGNGEYGSPTPHQIPSTHQTQEGTEGHLTLPDDEPEVIHLLLEYLYLLDYTPLTSTPPEETPSSHSGDTSDTMSIRTEPGQYGQVYGTSAISAFGGPQSPFGQIFRHRTESSLTVHALPTTSDFHGTFGRTSNRGRAGKGSARWEVSPLATATPGLKLHARMYAAGFKYGIEGLKGLALDKFKIQLTRHW